MIRHPRCRAVAVLCLTAVVIFTTSCSKKKSPANVDARATPSPSATTASDNYACTLLTSEEIAAVQGETVKATKPSEKSAGGLAISQCYFELPTASNSIVLTVTRKGEGGREPSESWQEIFHSEKRERKEEEEKAKPLKIDGVGEEAFWTGTRVGGALFALKGNVYLRISVGGAGTQEDKIEKCKTLAADALKRL